MADLPPLDASVLPRGIRSRFVDGVNGLRMHVLEAGGGEGRPLLLLLHGFPELPRDLRPCGEQQLGQYRLRMSDLEMCQHRKSCKCRAMFRLSYRRIRVEQDYPASICLATYTSAL